MHYFITNRIEEELTKYRQRNTHAPYIILISEDLLDMLVMDTQNMGMAILIGRPITKRDFLLKGIPFQYKGFPILIINNMIDYVRVVG